MQTCYPMYRGLQKPLTYKGFKGKFIYWGIASVVVGLVLGGLLGILTNMYLGAVATLMLIGAALTFTAYRQRGGLHRKTRSRGIIIHPNLLKMHQESNLNAA